MQGELIITIKVAGDFSPEINKIMQEQVERVDSFGLDQIKELVGDRHLVVSEIGTHTDRQRIGAAIISGKTTSTLTILG